MRLFSRQIDSLPDDQITFGYDLFSRNVFGNNLKQLVLNVEDPMVILLDAPWGSGKTTFLKMWMNNLKTSDINCIYFDAFENDYCGDAFSALAGEIVSAIDNDKKELKNSIIDCASDVAMALIKSGTRYAIKKTSLGILDNEAIDEISDSISTFSDESSSILASFVKERIKNRNKDKLSFENFRTILKSLPDKIYGENSKKPIVIIIDELDRCRPYFSMEIIECIKHFFSIDRVHFVLSMHTQQLESSIGKIYGIHEPQRYLEKFYNIKVSFPEDERPYDSNISIYLKSLMKDMPDDSEGGLHSKHVMSDIDDMSRLHNLSFRTVERIATNLALLYASTTGQFIRITPLVSVLVTMRTIAPQLYKKASQKKLKYDEVESFAKFYQWTNANRYDPDNAANWWKFCLMQNPPEETADYGRHIVKYSIHRENIVPAICSFIDQLRLLNI